MAIPVPEERFGSSFLISVGLHVFVVVLFFVLPYLLPNTTPITLGTGAGGGISGGSYTVGIADDLGGGEGMVKPSLTPQPAALIPAPKEEDTKANAVPIPSTIDPKKAKETQKPSAKQPDPKENVIPVPPQPGAGGTGGVSGGSGGGRGGGVGVEIGGGSGGFADSWYARAVESRIGANWIKPAFRERVEIVYSFIITNEGNIREVKIEKSSGNNDLDLTALRAIRASTPLPPLPPELRGRPVQFMAQFIYPPNP